jgi:hypothetical protein
VSRSVDASPCPFISFLSVFFLQHKMAFEKSKLSSLPPPPNDECSPRPKVRSCDLCVGCIVWLPSDSCDKSVKCCKKNCCGKVLGEDAYNSPVVVLKIRQRKGSSVRGDIMCYVANVSPLLPAASPTSSSPSPTELQPQSCQTLTLF